MVLRSFEWITVAFFAYFRKYDNSRETPSRYPRIAMLKLFRSKTVNALTPQVAYARARKGEIRLVDVREASEWAQMHVPDAIHAPLSDFASRIANLPKDRPLVFYCLSGQRSQRAVELCQQMKLPHDLHVVGGLTAWRSEGLPLER